MSFGRHSVIGTYEHLRSSDRGSLHHRMSSCLFPYERRNPVVKNWAPIEVSGRRRQYRTRSRGDVGFGLRNTHQSVQPKMKRKVGAVVILSLGRQRFIGLRQSTPLALSRRRKERRRRPGSILRSCS